MLAVAICGASLVGNGVAVRLARVRDRWRRAGDWSRTLRGLSDRALEVEIRKLRRADGVADGGGAAVTSTGASLF